VELLENGERVNLNPKIQLGTLFVASNVPDMASSATCSPGGHTWLNLLDINTGSYIDNTQSNPGNTVSKRVGPALAVGVNVIRLSNGKVIAITTTAENKDPVTETPVNSVNSPLKRISWRELLTD
jgi:type IV pilus assembly protein PilY1